MIGRTISHYKITAKLGQGGMGIVYKAEDTKLKRPVALKFLAAHLLNDEEIRARFTREAEAAAGLNHPNICHVYEIDEAEGKTFISMAFVEGDSLEKKIEGGPLKLNDALDIAIQTAKGLQAAHAKKVVHRDIKPANLMISDDGRVTIMDFGLALLADRSKLTRMDETMGTVTYMSPEQTYGMDLDHRTDIWALGVVLYEMVTGQQPFKGHYDKAVMYSITDEEPEPMTALRTGVPMALEWLAGKCMAKDREQRYQHTDEIIVDLQNQSDKLKSGKSTIIRTSPPPDVKPSAVDVGARHAVPAGPATDHGDQTLHTAPPDAEAEGIEQALTPYRVIERLSDEGDTVTYRAEDTQLHRSVAIKILPESDVQKGQIRERRRHLLSTTVSILAIGLAAVFAFLWWNQSVPEAPLRRFSFTPDNLSGGDENLSGGHVAISPDGKRIVYIAGQGETKLWVRNLDQAEARELDGTEEARGPFWSPDSQFIGFVTETEVRKVSVRGGAPMTLCKLPHRAFGGGTWSPGGDSIVFSSDFPLRLFQVPARGGPPEILFEPEESMGPHHWAPHFFPEASAGSIAFAAGSSGAPKIIVRDLQDRRNKVLADGDWPYYSPGGHLVFERDNDLWALPFSVASLEATGEAFPVAQNAQGPSMARDGTLIYTDVASADRQLVWRSRAGDRLDVIGQPQGGMARPSLSPDGRQVAVQSRVSGGADIWVHDIARGSRTRITFDTDSLQPTWSPSGRQITYMSFRGGFTEIFSASTDGSGNEIQLTDEPLNEADPDWSPDGRYLIYHTLGDPKTLRDLWYRETEPGGGTSDPVVFVQTRFNERVATFSRDGRFVAYCSDQSGRYEVYVRPFPKGGRVTKVSVGGGSQPRWGKNGKELFYVEGMTLLSVPVSGSGGFSAGLPKPLFDNAGLLAGLSLKPQYDVSDDGQRILLVEPVGDETAKPRSIHVVQNWFAEFKNRQPTP